MANEITVSGSLSFSKNGAKAGLSGSARADVTGSHYIADLADVGTTDESLSKGDIGTIGWCAFKNLDEDNYVSIGTDGSTYPIVLKAGEFITLRWNAAAVHAKANTASVQLEYLMVEA